MNSIDTIYAMHCGANTAISPHLPRLRAIADGLEHAVEFGVKRGASSSALLLGAKRVTSYDIAPTNEARHLKEIAGDRWDYRIENSKTARIFGACDLLFIDSQHDFETCHAELCAHGSHVKKFLVFHDTITFGSVGANGESGEHKWQYRKGFSCPADSLGIRPAIDLLMIRDQSWRIVASYSDSHGLLVLERRP